MINIDVKIGDIILTGKFKNKKVIVKTIGKNEYGLPTINGKNVVTFRVQKLIQKEHKLKLSSIIK